MNQNNQILPMLIYPVVMVTAVAAQLFMPNTGMQIVYAAYAVVLIGAVVITVLEWAMPERLTWRPSVEDIGRDALYMILLQVLFPRLLSFSVALLLLYVIDGGAGLWPSELHVGFQVVFMMLIADFFRYWLHRLAHTSHCLWRFHAVHHSPDKLYWLNTGRFHPVDKGLQFLFDALPFILLGVSSEVLSLYFVCYALNGFFQHSNIRLRFGWLNYIISTAELHRWHHSLNKSESDNNYGNNLIIWDWIFGTRYLPAGKKVESLGLNNADYPDTFAAQMIAPFQYRGRL